MGEETKLLKEKEVAQRKRDAQQRGAALHESHRKALMVQEIQRRAARRYEAEMLQESQIPMWEEDREGPFEILDSQTTLLPETPPPELPDDDLFALTQSKLKHNPRLM